MDAFTCVGRESCWQNFPVDWDAKWILVRGTNCQLAVHGFTEHYAAAFDSIYNTKYKIVRSMAVMIESMLDWHSTCQFECLLVSISIQCRQSVLPVSWTTQMLLDVLVRCLCTKSVKKKKNSEDPLFHTDSPRRTLGEVFLRFMGTARFCWWTPLICVVHWEYLVVSLP